MRSSSLLALAALTSLAACQTGQPDTERNPTTQAAADDSVAVAAADAMSPPDTRQLLPLLAGDWVQQSYLTAVARTKSPYQVRDSIAPVAELIIQPDKRRADSLLVGLNLGNHEGGEYALYFRPARHAQAIPFRYPDYEQPGNYYELSYATLTRDSLLRLNHYNRRGKLLSSVAYSRARLPRLPKADDGTNQGLQYEVNRLLLAGRYTGRDSVGHNLTVRFTPDGKVSGLANFKTYYVGTDFVAGPENNLDDITFNLYTNQQRTLAYRFRGDTLHLFARRPTASHVDLALGRLHYTLVRRR